MGRRLLAALLVSSALVAGCDPPQIGPDKQALRAVDALYTAIGLRDLGRVDQTEAELKKLADSGQLPPSASGAIEPAIALARRGEWEPALDRLARFMEGQHR